MEPIRISSCRGWFPSAIIGIDPKHWIKGVIAMPWTTLGMTLSQPSCQERICRDSRFQFRTYKHKLHKHFLFTVRFVCGLWGPPLIWLKMIHCWKRDPRDIKKNNILRAKGNHSRIKSLKKRGCSVCISYVCEFFDNIDMGATKIMKHGDICSLPPAIRVLHILHLPSFITKSQPHERVWAHWIHPPHGALCRCDGCRVSWSSPVRSLKEMGKGTTYIGSWFLSSCWIFQGTKPVTTSIPRYFLVTPVWFYDRRVCRCSDYLQYLQRTNFMLPGGTNNTRFSRWAASAFTISVFPVPLGPQNIKTKPDLEWSEIPDPKPWKIQTSGTFWVNVRTFSEMTYITYII